MQNGGAFCFEGRTFIGGIVRAAFGRLRNGAGHKAFACKAGRFFVGRYGYRADCRKVRRNEKLARSRTAGQHGARGSPKRALSDSGRFCGESCRIPSRVRAKPHGLDGDSRLTRRLERYLFEKRTCGVSRRPAEARSCRFHRQYGGEHARRVERRKQAV